MVQADLSNNIAHSLYLRLPMSLRQPAVLWHILRCCRSLHHTPGGAQEAHLELVPTKRECIQLHIVCDLDNRHYLHYNKLL